MLGLVRSVKNSLAPVNRIPPNLFLLIPKYWEECDMDRNAITLTHVCRGWRELLIADSSLWTHLDCTNVTKTRIYIERSKSSDLEISLQRRDGATYREDVFPLVVPHIGRVKSLNISGTEDILRNLTQHISRPIPLLEELTIDLTCGPAPVLSSALFNGDLPWLHTLVLSGVTTHLPWKNLSNLTTFELRFIPEDKISVRLFLDVLERTYRVRRVTLLGLVPTSSDAPPKRVVSLPCLENLTIVANPAHSTLLNHLCIPAGASLMLGFNLMGKAPRFRDYLPKKLENLKNLRSVASASLRFDERKRSLRLDGSSGRLYIITSQDGSLPSWKVDCQVFRSLNNFPLSAAQRPAVTKFKLPMATVMEKSTPYVVLHRMKGLRTLTLIQCNNLPFILALNPDQNLSKLTLCPKLEKIVLYVEEWESFNLSELMNMAKERASAGKRLSSIAIVGLGDLMPGREVFKLREYVMSVDYRVEERPPSWDSI